jgi:hypothetical protein
MAFLDNSGDIILDAVLTDTGRLRLAQGDGSFKISKFAVGDDEINYALYNKDHASGSAYYDLELLQTPVLEAFTNNTSNLKTKLISVSRTNILYMPVLKLNANAVDIALNAGQQGTSQTYSRTGDANGTDIAVGTHPQFYVAVDKFTYESLANEREVSGSATATDNSVTVTGLIQGYTTTSENADAFHLIRIDQGLDTSEIAPETGIDSDLVESAFIIETDYRLGRVKPYNTHNPTAVNYIDDDNIASYYITSNTYINPPGTVPPFEATSEDGLSKDKNDMQNNNPQVFEGPRGNSLQFRIHASQELQSSTYLFTQLGSTQTVATDGNIVGLDIDGLDDLKVAGKTIYYIDTIVRVVGANTGYRLDVPVRYVKIK